MKRQIGKILKFGLFSLFLSLIVHTTAQRVFANEGAPSSWQFSAGIYLWTPDVKGETTLGSDFDISFSDIIDNLDIAFMGMFTARKDRFSLLADVIYMDIEDDSDHLLFSGPLNQVSLSLINIEMEAWVITPAAAYTVLDAEILQLDLLVGARYLYIETETKLREVRPLGTRDTSPSESNDAWDGIVGARGNVKLNEKWSLPFHFDVGTGDTDLTWQAFGGIGYTINSVELVAGYRHLEWDFDDSDPGGEIFDDLYISGPVLGLRYLF